MRWRTCDRLSDKLDYWANARFDGNWLAQANIFIERSRLSVALRELLAETAIARNRRTEVKSVQSVMCVRLRELRRLKSERLDDR